MANADVLASFAIDPIRGLSRREVQERQLRFGKNLLAKSKPKSALRIFLRQFQSLIVALLTGAAALGFLVGESLEGAAIVGVLLVNALLGFLTEIRAVRSVEALQRLGRTTAKVRREGRIQEIPAEGLVPGDLTLLEAGDLVPADLRVLESSKLESDESLLTGESVPVQKDLNPLPAEIPVADRTNMVFRGTVVTRGSGEGVVVATGTSTELGKISTLVEAQAEERTPFELRLQRLGRQIVWITLAIAGGICIAAVLRSTDLFLALETAIALSVAAIPEGLPIVATIAMARGVWTMARRNTLVKRLSAMETLGSTSIILTDKTGTLTENRMTVAELWTSAGRISSAEVGLGTPEVVHLLRAGMLCNNAVLETAGPDSTVVGDPTEIALLRAGAAVNLDRPTLLQDLPELREDAFDPGTRAMATFHRGTGGVLVAVKGAPEEVLGASIAHLSAGAGADSSAAHLVGSHVAERPLSERDRADWTEAADLLGGEGLRVLALAEKVVDSADVEPYSGLTFLGLVGLLDPPREGIEQDLDAFRDAGIRVVMVTGDHAKTARVIARRTGLVGATEGRVVAGHEIEKAFQSDPRRARSLLDEVDVYARADPGQKMALLEAFQQEGEVVAMLGDGVNDAPALRSADVGVAMGGAGTQVAREAADIVIQDDEFSTILTAIKLGRVVFGNLRAFVVYLLSCNISEVATVGVATLAGAPLPLLPLQILFLNLITDVFPALALGLGKGSTAVMLRSPETVGGEILSKAHWKTMLGFGALITGTVLGAFILARELLGLEGDAAVSISFLTLALAQLLHVFNMREKGSSVLRNSVTTNPWVWAALALSGLLVAGALSMDFAARTLRLVPPSGSGWLLVLGMSVVPLGLGQVMRGRVTWGVGRPQDSRGRRKSQ